MIGGMKYDTDKMERVAAVRKWYKNDSPLMRAVFQGQEVGKTYDCELWKSEKGREKTMAIYAVDFDNTLAVTRFPEIVGPKEKELAVDP